MLKKREMQKPKISSLAHIIFFVNSVIHRIATLCKGKSYFKTAAKSAQKGLLQLDIEVQELQVHLSKEISIDA